jgi:hypothetical protein
VNLGALKTAVKAYGFSDDDPLLTWINAALHEFEEAYPWPFLDKVGTVVTVANLDTVALPADLFIAHKIRIPAEAETLIYVPRNQWEDEIEDHTDLGIPSHYTLVGLTSMLLYPIPDAIYSIRVSYRRLIADLAADGDIPDIPTKYHYKIVYGAAAIGLKTEEDADAQAQSARSDFDSAIASAISDFTGRQSGEFDSVRSVY